jgi:sugar-specific transcriptional regulator TrmB
MAVDYKASSEVSRQALVQAGLTPSQSAVYEALIHYGPQKATKIAFLAGVPRTLSYKVLDELEKQGLVAKKDEVGAVSIFTPAHPLKLKELAERRVEEAKEAKTALEGTLAKLISDFNTVAGSPGVRILEGVAGVAELLEDELNEGQPLKLIRSPQDMASPELNDLMTKHIKERIKLKIPVRSIGPLTGFTKQFIGSDPERYVERRVVPAEDLSIPAAVVIYANKVAITSYDGVLMTTIIENTAIRQTFEIIFEYLWKLSEPEHKKILATFQAQE